MSGSDWFSLAFVCILGAASPGPSLAVIVAVTHLHGRRGGCAAALGHGLGVFLYALVAAASLVFIITHYYSLFYAVQIAGSLLLVFIGGRLLLAAGQGNIDFPADIPRVHVSRSFLDGFFIAVFNPKIAAFFASLFSLYLSDGQSTLLHLIMATLAGIIDIAVYIIIVLIISIKKIKIIFSKYGFINDALLGSVLCLLGSVLFIQYFTHLF